MTGFKLELPWGITRGGEWIVVGAVWRSDVGSEVWWERSQSHPEEADEIQKMWTGA